MTRGCVLVSTGTLIRVTPSARDAIGRALSRLPARVLWKLSKEEISEDKSWMESLGSNIKVVTWFPQNDLLGHSNVKAFFTHGGLNSLYEAAWHGVPIVGSAGFADQADNVAKAYYQGWGIPLPSVIKVTEEQVFSALSRLLTNLTFYDEAQSMKKALRSRKRSGLQQAADWVEHAIDTNGAKYLLSPRNDMSYIAYHSLDVVAVWHVIILSAVLLVCCILRVVWLILRAGLGLVLPKKLKQH
eukprot:jgi/Botrbrau1/11962/Bobra.341_1s0027.1